MRENKFRAWSKEFNSFLEITLFEVIKGEITGIWHDGDYIGYDKEDITLMQYTGLKDKNGVEVYEGDICKSGEYIHVIKIGEFAPTWLDMICDKIGMIKRLTIYGVYAETKGECCIIESGDAFEVVGNIYENSELLEV